MGTIRFVKLASALCTALGAAATWPELGYEGVFDNWRGVIGTKGLTPAQAGIQNEPRLDAGYHHPDGHAA